MKTIEEVIKNKAILISSETVQELEDYFKKEQIQNKTTKQTFKNDDCVICLTNLPNVLFCNCGHIAICTECDILKCLDVCPVCRTKSTIKRKI